MEALEECLFMDRVPPKWEKRAYPSLLPLGAWYADLLMRLRELETWVSEFQVSQNTIKLKTNHYKQKPNMFHLFLASTVRMARWLF